MAVECNVVCEPEAIEDREQQQRVLGRFAKRFGLFDQHPCALHSRFGFRRRVTSDVHEGVYQRNLKFDLLTTQRRGSRQGRDLVKRAGQLRYSAWTIDEADNACFVVRDATRQALGYFYFEDEPDARRPSCSPATRRGGWPQTFAKLPEPLMVGTAIVSARSIGCSLDVAARTPAAPSLTPSPTPKGRGRTLFFLGQIPCGSSAWRRFRRRLDYLYVPARIRFHGFRGIAVPVHDVAIVFKTDNGASAVQLIVTSHAQHRDPFVAQHTALTYYPGTGRPNAHHPVFSSEEQTAWRLIPG